MMFIFGGVLLAIMFGLMIGSARQDRERDVKVRAVSDRISTRYKPDEIFVSPFDRSVIAVCRERGTLVLGDAEADVEVPFAALAEVEGLRDDAVLRRASRESGASGVAPDGPARDVVNIRSLDLRVTVDDPARPVWLVRFFDWPGGGVSPGNVLFQERARDTERWFTLVADAMRPPP